MLQTVPVSYRKNQPESDSKPRGKKQLRTSTDKETEVKEIEFGGGGGGVLCIFLFETFPGLSRKWEAENQIKETLKAEVRSLVLILPGPSISDTVTGSHLGNHAWVALFRDLLWR